MSTPTLPRKKYRLRRMNIDRVDLVDKGANQHSDIVFFKGQPDMDDTHVESTKKKKKKKGEKDVLADAKAALKKHYGPGDHPDGSPQTVHGGGGGGGHKIADKKFFRPRKIKAATRGEAMASYTKLIGGASGGIPNLKVRAYEATNHRADEWIIEGWVEESAPKRLKGSHRETQRQLLTAIQDSVKKHYGPGSHESGSDQDVHGDAGGGGQGTGLVSATVAGERVLVAPSSPDPTITRSGHRPLYTIAEEIVADWSPKGKGVNYAAKPYLSAMLALEDINDDYYADSAKSVVAYFLSNARSWTGPKAKEIKAELKSLAGFGKSAPSLEPVLAAFTKALIEADVFIEDATPEELRDMLSDKALADIGKSLMSAESAKPVKETDMSFDALELPDEVTDHIADLEDTVAELTKALEDLAEDELAVEVEVVDPIAKALADMPEEVAAVFKADREKVEALEADLAKKADEAADLEHIAKAATYAHVVESPEEFGPDLRKINEYDPEMAKRLETILESASARLAKSLLLEEVGSGIPSEATNAFEKATAIAKSMMADGAADNIEAARAQVWTMNPALFDEYREELRNRA